jgi:hypothetical protein
MNDEGKAALSQALFLALLGLLLLVVAQGSGYPGLN